MRFDDHELAAFAAPRHNAVSWDELRFELDMSEAAIRRRRNWGTMHRVGPRAYVVGSGALSFEGRARIGAIRGGTGSGVHMETALRLVDVVAFEPRSIDVLTPFRRRSSNGVRFHGTRRADAAELRTVNCVPSVSVARAIRGLAATTKSKRLGKYLREARYRNVLDLAELRDVTERERATPGHTAMVAAIEAFDLGDNGAWSGIEVLGWEVLHDIVDDEVPVQNEYLVLYGDEVFPDIRWRRSAVSVQFDGPPHLQANVLADDADADRLLRAHGDLVIRVPWFDLTRRREQVRADVRRAILEHRRLVDNPVTPSVGLRR